MNAYMARRIATAKNMECALELLCHIDLKGRIVTVSSDECPAVVTSAISDDEWHSVKLWASKNGLLKK